MSEILGFSGFESHVKLEIFYDAPLFRQKKSLQLFTKNQSKGSQDQK
jgi:hypothetical protein